MKYYHSNELDNLDTPMLLLRQSYAHVDCAIELCSRMIKDEFSASYSRGKVVGSLTYHAVELFLKALIFKKDSKVLRMMQSSELHDVNKLKHVAVEIYEDEKLGIHIPFQTEYLGFSEEDLEKNIQNDISDDQFYRYHMRLKGDKPTRVDVFSANDFLESLYELKKNFDDYVKLIEAL